jgi:hypothetical protein
MPESEPVFSEWTDEEREKSLADWVVDAAIEEYLMAKARRKRATERRSQ